MIEYITRAQHSADDAAFRGSEQSLTVLYASSKILCAWLNQKCTVVKKLRESSLALSRPAKKCRHWSYGQIDDTSITLMSMALDNITVHALVHTRWFPTSLLWRGIEIRTLIMQELWHGYDPPHPYLSPHPLELTLWLYWNSFTSQSWFPSGWTGQQHMRSYILKYSSQYPNPSSNSPECLL